ncbi:type IV pili methyl-accepting chemotaxis transducer N-terminal domain-containing protein [Oryzisolibacter propanilivorax]|nr:type IV pili methyl-accepting chemotaxis transducer N-terminal domain-containing protein [Oryzisolibacter propanilivorax]
MSIRRPARHRLSGAPSSRRVLLRMAAGALLWPTLVPLSAQARLALATAINITARYRALSQRAAKVYGLLVLQVGPARSRDLLEGVRKQLRDGLRALDGQGWPPAVVRLLVEVQQAAGQLDALLAQAPTRDTWQVVGKQADHLLASADQATQALEQLAQAPSARLVNTAGRQRMLSQRLARHYGLAAAGLGSDAGRRQMRDDAAEFERALAQLDAAPISTPAIRAALELGRGQWMFFQAALKRAPDARGLDDVASTSERLLQVMDELTGLYEGALRDVLG